MKKLGTCIAWGFVMAGIGYLCGRHISDIVNVKKEEAGDDACEASDVDRDAPRPAKEEETVFVRFEEKPEKKEPEKEPEKKEEKSEKPAEETAPEEKKEGPEKAE